MRAPAVLLCVAGTVLAGAFVAFGCSTSDGPGDADPATVTTTTDALPIDGRYREVAFIDAEEPAAMAVGADGALFIGERRTGRILRVDPDRQTAGAAESPQPQTVATLDVATDGQQGLLGLALLSGTPPAASSGTGDEVLFAAITSPNDGEARQEIVQVDGDGSVSTVWVGPVAAERAIGGHLAALPSGRLLIGLGDFLRGSAGSFGDDEPFSKLLSIDPGGPADQEPQVISSGWNNPFAFTVAPDGAVWIADNAPGDTPERIGRGDGEGPVIDLVGERAPSGLAVLGDDELALCGVVSGLLELVPIRDGEAQQPSAVLAESCQLGVLTLPGDRLAVAVADGVRILGR